MFPLRTFILRNRFLALTVILAALCMKALIPGGYMIGQNSKVLTVQICHDGLGKTISKQIVIPMNGDHGDPSGKQAKGDCAFSSLSMSFTAGANPVLLALALAFIMALGFAPLAFQSAKRALYLRPPLRGPPALI